VSEVKVITISEYHDKEEEANKQNNDNKWNPILLNDDHYLV